MQYLKGLSLRYTVITRGKKHSPQECINIIAVISFHIEMCSAVVKLCTFETRGQSFVLTTNVTIPWLKKYRVEHVYPMEEQSSVSGQVHRIKISLSFSMCTWYVRLNKEHQRKH